jgi:hypothetical protein
MNHRYLEVTFRNGRPVAGYLYLPRRSCDTSARTERREDGLVADFAEDGRPIGIEISAPERLSLQTLNRTLAELDQEPASDQEPAPLVAA